MPKRTKLREKAARVPEVREGKWDKAVPAYLRDLAPLNSESARSQRFGMLLQELFGEQPGFIEQYVQGIEKYVQVKEKDRVRRGSVDNLFGNLVIEFERDLRRKQGEAEEQLRRYVAALWSEEASEARRPYLCIATDGQVFNVYSPSPREGDEREIVPDHIRLDLLERTDWGAFEPRDVYFWLDRHFLREAILRPTTEDFIWDFGPKSHAFQVVGQKLLALWRGLGRDKGFSVFYESWDKYLRIVYGSPVGEDDLFIRHTYLASLAKLMVWQCMTEDGTRPTDDAIAKVLEGKFFKDQGIENFLEEDFFSWLVRPRAEREGVKTARLLLSALSKYHLPELSEDILKSLYQGLVDPKTRHDLGEFYTPDWLALRMVRDVLKGGADRSVLDPACGSGTFLYQAIKEKRRELGDSRSTLGHILEQVVGVDIHPLAVTVAKTNYVLALGELLKKRRGRIAIPIYLANSLKPPEPWLDAPNADYRETIDGKEVYLPRKLVDNPAQYDEAIEAAREYSLEHVGKPVAKEGFQSFLRLRSFAWAEDAGTAETLHRLCRALKELIEENRDTIWAFVLKNIYKPLSLMRKFDVVVGNPPWLSYRYVDQPDYQSFLKRQITKDYVLLKGAGHLITHMELATLFFLKAAHLYLKPDGAIAFVMPRSVFTADQHRALREGDFRGVGLAISRVWDLEEVKPLFNVPACVLFARRAEKGKVLYPLPAEKVSGDLGRHRRNASFDEAEERLSREEIVLSLHRAGKRSYWAVGRRGRALEASYYKKRFKEGATIVPRPFWFVEVRPVPLGFNQDAPPLQTSKRALKEAKDPYKGISFSDQVEREFLYATLLSTDLLPFGHLPPRLVVLPIKLSGSKYRIITPRDARQEGKIYLARWLDRAEGQWKEKRGEKAKKVNVYKWLDYRHKLTSQNPRARYRVLYPMSATYLCAAVIDPAALKFVVDNQTLSVRRFVADYVTFFIETGNLEEALYVVSMLNSPSIDMRIKRMQSRGQWGPRHICKKVLELPIPQFDPSAEEHVQLAELGKVCTEKVAEWLRQGGPGKVQSIGRLRGMVREMLAEELREIDGLVRKVVKLG